MRHSWLELLDDVLRPARPHRERCQREAQVHRAARRRVAEERTQALARCRARIESERAAIFAANDGVVSWRMRDLEREWRMLARTDPDGGLMELWARIAPATWIDRKRWRDSEPDARLDAAVALAADPHGVEAAEAAVDALRAALAAWGASIGARIRWRLDTCDGEQAREHEVASTTELLAEPLRAACDALAAHRVLPIVRERAEQLESDVHQAARGRFPARPHLARAIAHAARVDFVVRAASVPGRANPAMLLRDVWKTGYVIAAIDRAGVTLEIPPL